MCDLSSQPFLSHASQKQGFLVGGEEEEKKDLQTDIIPMADYLEVPSSTSPEYGIVQYHYKLSTITSRKSHVEQGWG